MQQQTGDTQYTQMLSRGINKSIDFLSTQFDYSLSEINHAVNDPSNYISEQLKKWDFKDETPFNPTYHSPAKKKK